MKRWLVRGLLSAAVMAAAGPSAAFWQRSQVSACSDATTEAERQRLRCWELNAYVDPGWPALGIGSGAYFGGAPVPPPTRWPKGGVTRRLG